jgi:hypothetical protein
MLYIIYCLFSIACGSLLILAYALFIQDIKDRREQSKKGKLNRD